MKTLDGAYRALKPIESPDNPFDKIEVSAAPRKSGLEAMIKDPAGQRSLPLTAVPPKEGEAELTPQAPPTDPLVDDRPTPFPTAKVDGGMPMAHVVKSQHIEDDPKSNDPWARMRVSTIDELKAKGFENAEFVSDRYIGARDDDDSPFGVGLPFIRIEGRDEKFEMALIQMHRVRIDPRHPLGLSFVTEKDPNGRIAVKEDPLSAEVLKTWEQGEACDFLAGEREFKSSSGKLVLNPIGGVIGAAIGAVADAGPWIKCKWSTAVTGNTNFRFIKGADNKLFISVAIENNRTEAPEVLEDDQVNALQKRAAKIANNRLLQKVADNATIAISSGFSLLELDPAVPEYVAGSGVAKKAKKNKVFKWLEKAMSRMFNSTLEQELAAEADAAQRVDPHARTLDFRVLPLVDRFNEKNRLAFGEVEARKIGSDLRLFQAVIDLNDPRACEFFDELVDAANDNSTLNVDLLNQYDLAPWMTVVDNCLQRASERSATKVTKAFGFRTEQQTYERDTVIRSLNRGAGAPILEREIGCVEHRGDHLDAPVKHSGKNPLPLKDGVDNVKYVTRLRGTVDKDDVPGDLELHSFSLSGGDQSTDATLSDTLRALAFADELDRMLGRDGNTKLSRVRRLKAHLDLLPDRKVMGIKTKDKSVGPLRTEFSLHMTSEAIERLLEHFPGYQGQLELELGRASFVSTLYDCLAESYARQHGLEKAPTWPVPHLDDDGWLGAVRRNGTISGADTAFLVARDTIRLLQEARDAATPEEQARLLNQAFSGMTGDQAIVAGFTEFIRELCGKDDVIVEYSVSGEALDQVLDGKEPERAEPDVALAPEPVPIPV